MFFRNEHDLIILLWVVVGALLLLAMVLGFITVLRTFQVRQFQDLLFKAERKIDTLERRMFNVLNAVPVALVETDTTGKFTFANKAAHQLLGRKDSELIGLRFHAATWGIAYPDGRAVPADLMPIARTLRGQTVKGFQHLLTNHGSHEKVLVSVTSMPITNNSHEVIGTTSAMVEIETYSGEGVNDLTGLWRGHWFGAATVPFWGLDAQGQILDVNNAALEAFEMKREDVLGKNWAQLFVEDGDFTAAIDYLGDIQDTASTGDPSVQLRLKAPGGHAHTCAVTGWVVRAQAGGENGLTVMAMPAEAVQTPYTIPTAVLLSDDERQELDDFRSGEQALAALGIGVWQYDPVADTIVEDAGMRALIGRETPGGPTLISDEDQLLANDAFARLKSGQDSEVQLDILITPKDGDQRWITLKGQSRFEDGEREIYGIAYDSTQWKQASAPAQAQPVEPTISEEMLQAARTEARDQGRQEAHDAFVAGLDAIKAEARQAAMDEFAAAQVAAQLARHADDDVYAWRSAGDTAAGETIVVREPDPAVLAENAALKAQLASANSEVEALRNAPAPEPVVVREADPATAEANEILKAQLAVLTGEIETLRTTPAAPDPAAVAEMEAIKQHMTDLESELEAVTAARDAIQDELDTVLAQPAPAPDFSEHEAQIQALRNQVDAARERHDDLAQRYHVLATTPDPEPDVSEHETRIATLEAELEQARNDMARVTAEAEALAAQPAPEPDYSRHEAHIADLKDELQEVRDAHNVLKSRYAELASTPAPQPDYSSYEARLTAANGELAKWQAAHRDLQNRLDQLSQALERNQAEAQAQAAGLQARIDQMTAALSNAQRFETVGRLTGDVAQDFAQMLQVVNGALDVMARTSESPESVRRLAEAALAAGKRGERLTRQLQAFQSEEY